jgi:hypothetical protein
MATTQTQTPSPAIEQPPTHNHLHQVVDLGLRGRKQSRERVAQRQTERKKKKKKKKKREKREDRIKHNKKLYKLLQ